MTPDGDDSVRKQHDQEKSFAETDPVPEGEGGDLDVVPGPGGYAGRDPKTEMPARPQRAGDPGGSGHP